MYLITWQSGTDILNAGLTVFSDTATTGTTGGDTYHARCRDRGALSLRLCGDLDSKDTAAATAIHATLPQHLCAPPGMTPRAVNEVITAGNAALKPCG